MKKSEQHDQKRMDRCLELALKGARWVSPNPMVGCIIEKNGIIVSEGYHHRYGGQHAEVDALRKAGRRAVGSTVYMNLEPCSHYGKTPPCVDALLAAGVKKVVVATQDPNPIIAGRGIRLLRKEGIEVVTGVRRTEAMRLNEKFFTFMTNGLPFVGLKIAQTLDGKIADARGTSRWMTSAASRKYVHELRSSYHAVLVGANTVLRDNPELTVRHVRGRNPVRIVLDGKMRLDAHYNVFRSRTVKTLFITSARVARNKPRVMKRLMKQGVDIIALDWATWLEPATVLRVLGGLGITSVLLEGGSRTTSPFLQGGLVHKLHCFLAPKILGGGLSSLTLDPPLKLAHAMALSDVQLTRFGSDICIEGYWRTTR